MANGSFRYYEDSTCHKHKVDGSLRKTNYYKGMIPRIREQNWKQKGIKMTVEEYNKLFQDQDGRCAICHRHQSELKRKLAVDHCHKTGQIRGLLCGRCNVFVAHIDDFPESPEAAVKYLNVTI